MNIRKLNIYCTLILCLLGSSFAFAQDAEKVDFKSVQESMNTSLDGLSPEFQYQILAEALKSSNADVKKMMKKAMKKMTPKQQMDMMTFAERKQQQAKMLGDRPASNSRVITPTNKNNAGTSKSPVAINPRTKAAQMGKSASSAKPTAPVGPTTTCSFDATDFDFGIIPQGESVTHIFKLKNTGKQPLIISNAKGSCGCTVPKWPKEPIAVGATADIEVTFNSRGKKGKQNKRVTLTANTDPAQTFIYMKGEVDVPTAPTAAPAGNGGK